MNEKGDEDMIDLYSDNETKMYNKKQAMIDIYVQKCMKKRDTDTTSSLGSVSDASKSLDKVNMNDKKVAQDESLKKTVKQLKSENSKLRNSNKKVREEKYEISKNLSELRIEFKKIESVVDEKDLMIKSLMDKLEASKRELEAERVLYNKKSVDKVKSQIKHYKRENRKLASKVKSMVETIKNYQVLREGEILNDKCKRLSKELQDKDAQIISLRKRVAESDRTITKLNKRDRMYDVSDNVLEGKEPKVDSLVENVVTVESKKREFFGTVEKSGDVVIFKSIYGWVMDISNETENIDGYIGYPVKAVGEDDGTVVIVEKYDEYKLDATSDNNFCVKNSKKKSTVEEYVPKIFNGERVLLVGERFQTKYVRYLTAIGLDVEWYGAYSGGIHLLNDVAKGSDVVVVCTSHCPHVVVTKLKMTLDYSEDNFKYQFIEKDSINNLVGRISYALENMKND